MRLKQIVLTGFKSFAKRSVIAVGDGLLGLVGPNGCGKSNVVDALRWVMGESRASQLRQEISADIIFNGAATQRAADWCSVELLLANDGSRDLGMWSEYAELSVRRQLERDGDSSYFINGQRVRRRDVVDLFAGTGSGARSYGIVEQERITTIVRAEPKRIRGHLEEAAGVAIYKERRRETETRIKAARANLDRIDDSLGELRRQRDALAKQAQLTAKMREARQRLEVARQLGLQLRLEELTAAADEAAAAAQGATGRVSTLRKQHAATEKEVAALHKQRHKRSAEGNKLQARYYGAMADKEKHEQALREYAAATARARELIDEATAEAKELAERVEQLTAEEQANRKRQRELESRSKAAAAAIGGGETELRAAGKSLHAAQEKLAQAEEAQAAASQQRGESQAACELLRQRLADAGKALAAAEHELAHLAPAPAPDARSLERVRSSAAKARQAAQDNERQRRELGVEQAEAKEEILRLQGEQGGLRAEQELLRQIAGKIKDRYAQWLAARGLGAAATLAEAAGIKAPGCEKAVDAALGHLLEGFVAPNLPRLLAAAEPPEGLVLVDPKLAGTPPQAPAPPAGLVPLLERVEAAPKWRPLLGYWLAQAFLAPDHATAVAALPQLAPGQLVVVSDGSCFVPGAVSARRSRKAGVEWNSRLKRAESRLQELERLLVAAEGKHARLGERAAELEAKAAELLAQRERDEEALTQEEQEALRRKHAADYHAEQSKRLRAALERGRKDIAAQEKKQQAAQRRLEQDEQRTAKAAASAASCRDERQAAVAALEASRAAHGELKTALHEAQLQEQLNQQRCADLQARVVEVKLALGKARTSIVKHQEQYQQRDHASLDRAIAAADEEVAAAKQAVDALEQGIKEMDESRQAKEAALQELRAALEEAEQGSRAGEVEVAAKRAEAQAVKGRLAERGVDEDALAQLRKRYGTLAEVTSLAERLEKRIASAGEVNYAAEEEHRACEERLAGIEAQQADVNQALAALQDAIKRIDDEMLGRIKDVHGQLNIKFSALFQKLFDGGSAAIELDSDDFLAAEMQLKVSLPGKRVAHIQALSGGEKTLTALAFIFALNELNPPPFCVLDEVDAALDDANTQRFCNLLDTMRERSQFLLVTHNRQVIERADRLVGVTQEEKGVTKLVAVQLDEAVEQARAAG